MSKRRVHRFGHFARNARDGAHVHRAGGTLRSYRCVSGGRDSVGSLGLVRRGACRPGIYLLYPLHDPPMAAGSGPGTPSCRPRRQVVHFGLWSARSLAPVVQVSTVRLVASILSAPAGGTRNRAHPTGWLQWCRAGISTVVSWVRRLCSNRQAGVTPNPRDRPLPVTIEECSIERYSMRTRNERCRAVSWLWLSDATTLIHRDVQKARERLQLAISKAWLVPLD